MPYTASGCDDDGWNLPGNPARADLAWPDARGDATTDFDVTAYGFEPTSGWMSFDVASEAGSGTAPLATGRIPAGTAFFVRAGTASPSLAASASTARPSAYAVDLPGQAMPTESGRLAARDAPEWNGRDRSQERAR